MSALATVILIGLDAALPAASIAGRLYIATDTNKLYRDTGTAWTPGVLGGTTITLQHGGVANGSQGLLNLKAGTNITIADDGAGGITITAAGGGGGGLTWTQEIPTGAIDSSNNAYTLAHTPSILMYFRNGQLQEPSGANQQYSLSTNTITVTRGAMSDVTGDYHRAVYGY